MPRFPHPVRFEFCLVAAMLAISVPLSANLLVAPSGSDTIVTGSADDLVFGPFNLGFSFNFFGGGAVTQANLSSNGNLQFGTGDHTFANQPLPYPTALIAPFWEDLIIPSGDLRYNNTVANQFTVIWNGVGLFLVPGEVVTAQAILLGVGNGFGYAANSIILSYGTITSTKDNDVTAGLSNGDTLRTCVPGGASDCTFTTVQALALQNRAFLFTPVIGAAPGYAVSEINSIPEPSGFILAGLGLVLVAARWRSQFGSPVLPEDPRRLSWKRNLMTQAQYLLDGKRRAVTLQGIKEACSRRGWILLAVHVRSGHVHAVVDADRNPELAMGALKAYASRALNESGA